ncbi:nuclear transport factor 2 family protein [Chloroflexota bacterium]
MVEKSLEQRIQRMEDIHEIHNLMGRYVYLQLANMHDEQVDFFARKTPGVRAEIANWGVYEGFEGAKKLYAGVHNYTDGDCVGRLSVHTLTTPVIEVAGDGKTAKAVWISPGAGAGRRDGRITAYWVWGKYAVDLVKEDGKWKFWHFRVYAIFSTPFDRSWVDIEPNPSIQSKLPDELKDDKPTTYHWEYSPTAITENIPAPPEPYDIFDERDAY